MRNPGRSVRTFHPSTAISLLALFVALGGTAFAATDGSGTAEPEATVGKALESKKLKIRQASVAVDGGTFNANYNTRTVAAKCRRGEVALSVSTQWDAGDNTELVTSFARLTTNRSGTPTGAVARGASDVPGTQNFRVQVLCAG
ncbi:MAG TPA: hypothetical protein VEX39_04030 [Thermoleophilaceae bacterium]|nr:hypothetical protein [Thermoleophilaceae bacterium]